MLKSIIELVKFENIIAIISLLGILFDFKNIQKTETLMNFKYTKVLLLVLIAMYMALGSISEYYSYINYDIINVFRDNRIIPSEITNQNVINALNESHAKDMKSSNEQIQNAIQEIKKNNIIISTGIILIHIFIRGIKNMNLLFQELHFIFILVYGFLFHTILCKINPVIIHMQTNRSTVNNFYRLDFFKDITIIINLWILFIFVISVIYINRDENNFFTKKLLCFSYISFFLGKLIVPFSRYIGLSMLFCIVVSCLIIFIWYSYSSNELEQEISIAFEHTDIEFDVKVILDCKDYIFFEHEDVKNKKSYLYKYNKEYIKYIRKEL